MDFDCPVCWDGNIRQMSLEEHSGQGGLSPDPLFLQTAQSAGSPWSYVAPVFVSDLVPLLTCTQSEGGFVPRLAVCNQIC